MTIISRSFAHTIQAHLDEKTPLIQVILGPRQVGKTTGIKNLLSQIQSPTHYASADDLIAGGRDWILKEWQTAKQLGPEAILVLDEVQKIPNWSETIKLLWDAQAPEYPIQLILLGSSSLTLQTGLSESLAGRFELTPAHHWRYQESNTAFNLSLDDYLLFGGYPGSYAFRNDYDRWHAYIHHSIIETVIGRDILHTRHVAKPALFRQTFELACHYPAQEISYTKLLGQLQDKGNTDTVKYYLELLEGAFLFRILHKYSKNVLRSRTSSPKIQPLCPALHTIFTGPDILNDAVTKGHLFELAVGAILNELPGQLFYWREGNMEVDFIYEYRGKCFAIEVKSGRKKSEKGMTAFTNIYPAAIPVFITWDNFITFDQDPIGFFARLR